MFLLLDCVVKLTAVFQEKSDFMKALTTVSS